MPATCATNSNNNSSSKAAITKQRQGGSGGRKEQEEGQKGVEAASVLCVRVAPRRTFISWPESFQIDQQLLCCCSALPGPRKACRCRGCG
ncbi:hypothetical protein CDAR_440801 [Caerostris darwini]|uniref:Uncharacterized protein n=1 Tax=Caerostris darwini TaxID=1538125 RepID=A0AAV4MLE3_9ARAC|nr:hypothetical protein CDAR_440801 [Caerostris darwini]